VRAELIEATHPPPARQSPNDGRVIAELNTFFSRGSAAYAPVVACEDMRRSGTFKAQRKMSEAELKNLWERIESTVELTSAFVRRRCEAGGGRLCWVPRS
jgi:hypothetical protein